jgi:predicted negative regulator of RcsB-dependent stress response|tara:strand:- start:3917 stop:4561 length:645 start_codon:yes stop_codon:yes gene_type:complete
MDEDIATINNNTRNEKLKNFFKNNKKILISILLILIIVLISYFTYGEYKDKKRLKISDQYNSLVTEYSKNNVETIKNALIELIKTNDSTYSPLSLYFIIDNKLTTDISEINSLFDSIIENVALEKEIKNLIIYKKALFNAENSEENELLEILNPIINSNSIWKSHALYLMAEYFYSKNQKQKSKEFFNQIVILQDANQDLKIESQKRLSRDLSE